MNHSLLSVFGMTNGEGVASTDQPYKYNGKELDQMHGLNWYDYEARMYASYRFTTPDPLGDKYPDLSPYGYCANNRSSLMPLVYQ